MKVWYILMTFPSTTETFVANDVRALVRLGVDVSVHALRGPRRDAEQLLGERGLAALEITHGSAGNLLRGLLVSLSRPLHAIRLAGWVARQSGGRSIHLLKGLALLPRILGLFERLKRESPDVVHIYWGHYPAIFGWLTLERAPGVVVSLSLSAYDLLCAYPGSAKVARRAHLVSTWSAANVPAIAECGIPPKAVHVSWQGVDFENIKGLNFEKVPHRIVTAGRLVADKGFDDVLRAFARLSSHYPDARLVILGDGPERVSLVKLAATLGIGHATTFRGHVSHQEVFDELARAELFLFLSRYAGDRLPNVVKEAMACRCLVVTTATVGIDELMKDGVHGWIVPMDGWEQAAERAVEALTDAESTHAMTAAAQHHVLEHFDVVRLMAEMVRKWEERGASGTSTAPGSRRRHLLGARGDELGVTISTRANQKVLEGNE